MTNAELTKLGHTLGTAVMLGIVVFGRKANLWRENRMLKSELMSANKRALYLAQILDEKGIELDEFDHIALREL